MGGPPWGLAGGPGYGCCLQLLLGTTIAVYKVAVYKYWASSTLDLDGW